MKKYIALILIILTFCNGISLYADAENDTAEFDDASIIAVMKPSTGAISLFSLNSVFDGFGISEVENLSKSVSGGISLFNVSSEEQVLKLTLEEPGTENVLDTIEKLNDIYEVDFAQPNFIYTLYSTPNDTYYKNGSQYGLTKISAESVWDMDIDCSDVTVAIVDSGMMMTHEDLTGNLWENSGETDGNSSDDDGNNYIDDINGWDFIDDDNVPEDTVGHGTHVAGIVSAVTNNGKGVASLARNAKIAPLKIFKKTTVDGEEQTVANTSDIYKAFKYIKQMKFPIVNCSFGGTGEDTVTKMLIEECSDTLFVVAAGNDTSSDAVYDNDTVPIYPASYDCDNIIAVASSDSTDNLSYFSHYGAVSVDIAAPGSSIASTYYSGAASYINSSGTSMAAPMVAGAAAVLKAKYPDMTPAEMVEKLMSSADKLDSLDGKVASGARLNAYEALLIHAESVSLQSSVTINKGDTLTLEAEVLPADTTDNALWQSSDTDVATVDNGTVTAKEYGTSIITVTYGDVSDSCTVTVPEPTPIPSPEPTEIPSPEPTAAVNPEPTATVSPEPTAAVSPEPTPIPSPEPTETPSPEPTEAASPEPTETPSPEPTEAASPEPTEIPSPKPIVVVSPEPTATLSPEPTEIPSPKPTAAASPEPTETPSPEPTEAVSPEPTTAVSPEPTTAPSPEPTEAVSPEPTTAPSPATDLIPTSTPGRNTDYTFVNRANIERDGNQIKIILEFSEAADEDNIVLFAAIREDYMLKGVIMPEIKNMSAEFCIPDGVEDITIYIWDKNCKPYMDPIQIE